MNPLWLDRALGDPAAEGPTGFRSLVDHDEREVFPAEAASILDSLGVPAHYVPAALGGELRTYEGLAWILRAMARRDLTLAVGHGKTILGTQPVFLGGDLAIQRAVATRVLAREPVALAITERGNGSDLLASAVRADRGSTSTLSGEKWLVNNATRSTAMCVFARTRASGGPRGFSLFFADKQEMGRACTPLAKIRTHGIRGADISGARFDAAPCSAEPIGGEGAALALVLRTFIVTRTLIASVAAGALDSALGVVLQFARRRELYGSTVLQLPHARDLLAGAIANHIGSELAALAGARLLAADPGQATFWSSVLKAHVPARAEATLRDLAFVFGARHYLREGDAHGVFQKVQRDTAILGVFDGNTAVNLTNLAIHATALARGEASSPPEAAFTLGAPLPALAPSRLSLVSARVTGAEALARHALERLRGRAHEERLRPLLDRVASEAVELRSELTQAAPAGALDMTSAVVTRASRYAELAAVALSACVFVHAGAKAATIVREGDWLVLLLSRTFGADVDAPHLHAPRERLLSFALDAVDAGAPITTLIDRDDQGTP